MKKTVIFLIAAAAIAAVWLWAREPGLAKYQGDYRKDTVRLSFSYPKGYVLSEAPTRITLMTAEDSASLGSGEREGGEAPPAIVFRQYDNPNNPGPLEWAETYPQLSNFNLKTGEVEPIAVGGFSGVSYEADGLYQSRNVVFSDGTRIYYLRGEYLDRDSSLYRDFPGIVSSVTVE